ncbi:hypothetical protein Ancab_008798 [Ancistrocladus abbreviatus]
MGKRYAILKKKVGDLESLLNTSLVDTPCQRHQQPQFPVSEEEIEQRLSFLRTLLSAEMAAHHPPYSNPKLSHIAHKFQILEAAFRNPIPTDNFTGISSVTINNDEHLGSDSTCSCTESCQNDYVEEDNEEEEDDHDQGNRALGFKIYENPMFLANQRALIEANREWREDGRQLKGAVRPEEEEEERVVVGVAGGWKYWRVMASGGGGWCGCHGLLQQRAKDYFETDKKKGGGVTLAAESWVSAR